jgi:hypothetical protein
MILEFQKFRILFNVKRCGDEMANIVNRQLIAILHLSALKGLNFFLLILRICAMV